jgi:hypothetical protein
LISCCCVCDHCFCCFLFFLYLQKDFNSKKMDQAAAPVIEPLKNFAKESQRLLNRCTKPSGKGMLGLVLMSTPRLTDFVSCFFVWSGRIPSDGGGERDRSGRRGLDRVCGQADVHPD